MSTPAGNNLRNRIGQMMGRGGMVKEVRVPITRPSGETVIQSVYWEITRYDPQTGLAITEVELPKLEVDGEAVSAKEIAFCQRCGRVLSNATFRRCSRCGIGVGRVCCGVEHEDECYCRRCYGRARVRRTLAGAAKLILSPFVEWKED